MEKKLVLNDFYFGQPDAKDEIISNDEKDIRRFFLSFLTPENFLIDDYIFGKTLFISGFKGTGKTALLRYIAIDAENRGYLTSITLFKSNFDNQDKKDFSHAARVISPDINDKTFSSEEDYSLVWRWFLYKQIAGTIDEKEEHIFKKNKHWNKFNGIIKSVRPNGSKESILPKIKRGNIELNFPNSIIQASLGLEFEGKEENIRFSDIVKRLDNLFEKLEVTNSRLYIFIDELELVFKNKKEYERDIKLITGLIMAIKRIYCTCLKLKYPVKIMCGIRSEVLRSIESSGNEINKEIEGYGSEISWTMSGGNIVDHPLIRMIKRRLESAHDENKIIDKDDLFHKYFPYKLQNVEAEKYLLNLSWDRPRDIVRLLNIAIDKYPKEDMFYHKIFDSIKRDYGNKAWIELREELRAQYDNDSLETIHEILSGILNPFTFDDFVHQIEVKRKFYDTNINKLLSKYDIGSIISSLYRIGVIGNYRGYRFSYKGFDKPILEEPFIIHRALWSQFGTVKNKKYFNTELNHRRSR